MDKDKKDNVGKEEKEMSSLTMREIQDNRPPIVKMKQMAQEAMQKKGLTIEDIRKLTGIKRYEKKD
jgi:hypothetical protein